MAIKLSTQAISSMHLHSVGDKIYPTFALSLSLILLFFGLLPSQADAASLAWSPGSDLPQAVELSKAVRSGNLVYVIGGRDSGGAATNVVYRARIGINGVVGDWEPVRSLPNPLYFHAAAVVNGHIFVIGGWDGSKWRRELWRAAIQNDGSLGEWVDMGLYPIEIALHGVIGVGSRIYVVGGQNNASGGLNEVRFAEVQTNGSLGNWVQTSSLPAVRYRLSVAATDKYIYAVGGYDGANAQRSVYVATIRGDGHLEPWRTVNELSEARYYHSSHIRNGRLTVIGGQGEGAELRSVCSALINNDGSLGQWLCGNENNEPNLNVTLQRFAAVTYPILGQDAILVMGGRSGGVLQTKSYILTEPGMDLILYNTPTGFVAPSQEIEYTVRYQNRPFFDLADVWVVVTVPNSVTLVPNSQGAGSLSGNQITWNVGVLGKGAANTLSYRVRRDHPADGITSSPSLTSALGITKTGPLLAEVGKSFTYTLVITTDVPINYKLTVADTLTRGLAYMGATLGPGGVAELMPNNVISVTFAKPDIKAGQSITIALSVMPTQTGILENRYFAVIGEYDPAPGPERTSGDVIQYIAYGLAPVITVVVPDCSKVDHAAAQATWEYASIPGASASNSVSNGICELRLPLIFRSNSVSNGNSELRLPLIFRN